MNHPVSFVSVIVPIYNSRKSLSRCVESILNQTFSNFELLLIDDGSEDDSGSLCDKYAGKDKRVRVFHTVNHGVSAARNIGLDNARGEWIAFVDSDDWVDNNYLSNYVDNITSDTLVIQGFDYTREGKSELCLHEGTVFRGSVQNGVNLLFSQLMPGAVWNKLFDKQILQKYQLRFNETISYREDELFVLGYLKHVAGILMVDTNSYKYYQPRWNTKYCGDKNKILSESLVIKELYGLFGGERPLIVQQYIHNYCCDYFGLFSESNDYQTLLESTIAFNEIVHLFPEEKLPVSTATQYLLKYVKETHVLVFLFIIKQKFHINH